MSSLISSIQSLFLGRSPAPKEVASESKESTSAPSPKRVAIIGAGVSGVVSAKYLKESGLEVVVYERSKAAGGNWLYDERISHEPTYPSIKPSIADFVIDSEVGSAEKNGTGSVDEIAFAPPGAGYSGLTSNVPTGLQTLKGFPWPEGTGDYVNVREKQKYIQSYSSAFDVERLIKYNTRVEKLEKVGNKWKLRSSELISDGNKGFHTFQATDEFDLVVVASGHYHAARVPDIPGLKEWKKKWPERVQHSKGYRVPNGYKDQTVLLIGAGTSSTDIAKECTPFAKKIYQTSRGGAFDHPLSFLPPGTDRVASVSSFEPPSDADSSGTVTLVDGTVLHDIDRVIICTGYLVSKPFLPHLHDDTVSPKDANDTIVVSDGTQYHNLHKDIFYIPDPTLAFVGVPAYSATFTLFEYQAIAVDAVFAGRAQLPPTKELRAEYAAKVEKKGYGRGFHSIRNEEVEYVLDLTAWLNADAERNGTKKIEPHSEEWIAERKRAFAKFQDSLKFSTHKSPDT